VRASLVAAVAGFLLVTPYALLDAPRFLMGVSYEGGNVFTGLAGIAVSPIHYLWTFHLRYSILPGLGWLPTLLALSALVLAFRSSQPAIRLLTVPVFALYTVFETSPYKPPPNFDRYVVPLLPFLAVLAALALRDAHRFLARRAYRTAQVVVPLVFFASLVGPLVDSARLDAAMATDTRQEALNWLVEHACGSNKILLEGALKVGGALVPSYVPALPPGCDATYTYSLAPRRDEMANYDFIVASSFMYDRFLRFASAPPETRAFYRRFFATHRRVAEFTAAYRTFGFHNPTIRIYRQRP